MLHQMKAQKNINPLSSDKGKNESSIYGRISKIKGVSDLLQAWEKEDTGNWKLTLVGPWDEDLIKLKNSVKDNQSIDIKGPIYGAARFDYLNKADAFILPSYGEGLPTALLEAAHNGKMILCTYECNFNELQNVGGVIFFIQDLTGLQKL